MGGDKIFLEIVAGSPFNEPATQAKEYTTRITGHSLRNTLPELPFFEECTTLWKDQIQHEVETIVN